MSHETHGDHCGFCRHAPSSVSQTLDEMEFERGIWSAAMNGDIEKVRKLLRDGKNPNVLDTSGYTALHYAARHGKTEVCRALLDAGADVNVQTLSGRATALHRAVYSGHCDVVQLLLQRGADLSLVDADGQTVLHKACEGAASAQIVKTLLNVNDGLRLVCDKRNRTPIDCLPSSSCTDTELRLLLSNSDR